ncbi:hypothetical protein KW789_00500 [Candidatus Saccharibacteria bacterium]|nr:hypothetical protein [Candidatus Saccharibacteria bacterium]
MATQQLTKQERQRRERVRLDSIEDSKKLFEKKTRGLQHTHPTYKEELGRHRSRLDAIDRQYGSG